MYYGITLPQNHVETAAMIGICTSDQSHNLSSPTFLLTPTLKILASYRVDSGWIRFQTFRRISDYGQDNALFWLTVGLSLFATSIKEHG